MKRLIFTLLALLLVTDAFTCTNLLVSKGASKDGSVMVSYAADSHTRYGTLVYMPRGSHPKGEMIEVREWGKERFLGYIPQVPYTYNVIGNMNDLRKRRFIGIGFILGGNDFGIYLVFPMIITIGLIILYCVIHTLVAIWKSSSQPKE